MTTIKWITCAILSMKTVINEGYFDNFSKSSLAPLISAGGHFSPRATSSYIHTHSFPYFSTEIDHADSAVSAQHFLTITRSLLRDRKDYFSLGVSSFIVNKVKYTTIVLIMSKGILPARFACTPLSDSTYGRVLPPPAPRRLHLKHHIENGLQVVPVGTKRPQAIIITSLYSSDV